MQPDAAAKYHGDLVQRAITAYQRRLGAGAPRPCGALSGVLTVDHRAYVILRSETGELGRYRVRHDGLLQWERQNSNGGLNA